VTESSKSERTHAEVTAEVTATPVLKLQMVDPSELLHLQMSDEVEVDYSGIVTSAAQISLTPMPETAKTVKWKKTNLVTVSHVESC